MSNPTKHNSSDEPRLQLSKLRFLIVDDNPEGRFMLGRTLLRKYPNATCHECHAVGDALREIELHEIDLIVAHRTVELDGVSLVRELRQHAPDVPIIMVSGANQRPEALQAGADHFLLYDEWLMIGNPVAHLLEDFATRRQSAESSNLPAP